MNVLNAQKTKLARILSEPPFKVLILDSTTQKIIATIFKQNHLKELGVVSFMLIDKHRDKTSGSAVYYIEPSPSSLSKLKYDISCGIFDEFLIYFTTSISSYDLSSLAEVVRKALSGGLKFRVSKVIDTYSSFVSLSPYSFSFDIPKVYSFLHSPSSSDQNILSTLDTIADRTLSILLTLKALPIIRSSPGGPSEQVSSLLSNKIRSLLIEHGELTLFENLDDRSGLRPLLVFMDRDIDMVTPLKHSWNYQALLADVFNMTHNRVRIPGKDFDLDYTSDEFFSKYAHSPFPEVATVVNEKFLEYSQKRNTMASGNVATAMDSLPHLAQEKKVLDMHISLATELMNVIKTRHLDKFHEFESNISKSSVSSMLSNIENFQGTDEDRARALLSLFLRRYPEFTQDLLDQAIRILKEYSPALKYFQMLVSMRNLDTTNELPTGSQNPQNVMRDILSAGFKNIKSILPSKDESPLMKILHSLTDQTGSYHEKFTYLNPRSDAHVRAKGSFKDVLVIVVGGGSFSELATVSDYALKAGKNIAYGATHFPSPDEFLKEICDIGKLL
jgi:sec1 family domain-containing protein 1